MLINPYRFTPPSGGLLLDTYTGAAVAYSVARKLRTAYSGSCMRIRRANDSAEQDIGFSGDDVDTGAITSFISSNTAFIVTLYDQSTNARNATQATVNLQPMIALAGSILTSGGKPAMNFIDSNVGSIANALELTPSWHAANAASLWAFSQYVLNADGDSPYILGSVANARGLAIYHNGATRQPRTSTYRSSATTLTSGTGISSTRVIRSDGATRASNLESYINGSQVFSSADNNSDFVLPANNYLLGNTFSGSIRADFSMSEIILYDSDQSANRAGIESNLNTYYAVY